MCRWSAQKALFLQEGLWCLRRKTPNVRLRGGYTDFCTRKLVGSNQSPQTGVIIKWGNENCLSKKGERMLGGESF